VLLWWAIGYRLLEYGLTEVRAIVVYLALFLSFITLYFGFAPKTRIIVVPITLLMVTFLFQHGGPLSAKSLSFHSQMGQWNNIKKQSNAYTANEAKDVLRYLSRYHPEQAALYCLQCDTNSLNVENVEDYDWAANQMESAKFSFKEDSIETAVNRIIRFENNQFIALNGYQELIEINTQESDVPFSDGLSARIITENIDNPEHQNETIQIQFRNKEGVVHSEFIGQMKEKIKLIVKSKAHSNDLILEHFFIDFAYNENQYRFITSELNYDQDSDQLYYMKGHLLLKKK
jgi:hypothetical protein